MPRLKTFLTPDDQWKRTVEYLYFLHLNKWTEWENWLRCYEYRNNAPKLNEEELRLLWRKEQNAGPHVGEHDSLYIVSKSSRLLNVGDVLIMSVNNGMGQRYPVFGVSSKGARLCYYYLPCDSTYYQRSTDDIVELQDDHIGLRWDDPAIRRLVVDLRASFRSRVGACSPAPSNC